MPPLSFEPLYHADRLRTVNPRGDVGMLTLWSPLRAVERKLGAEAPGLLDAPTSRVAVVANLYGDGMYAMFCNLLFNPQIRHLVAVGEDLGLPTCDEIRAFLRDGLEAATMLGRPFARIRGTERLFPALPEFDAEVLRARLTFAAFGKLSRPGLAAELQAHVDGLPAVGGGEERIRVDIPEEAPAQDSRRPSEVAAHQVVRRRPLDCWTELVVRCVRFGRPVALRKGARLELLNARVVITEPADDPAPALAEHGFSLERFRAYQRRILDPALPEGISYTYGNRLRGYFAQDAEAGTDTLQSVIAALRRDPESRHGYVALWDTATDLPRRVADTPCLTTLFFRRTEDKLALTATYRSHNLLVAWLENVYGLMAIQRHVAAAVDLPAGPITVVSHSLGIDPASPRYELARSLAEGWTSDDDVDRATGKRTLREDPHGYFLVSVDRDRERPCIVAEHRHAGVLVKRYEGERSVDVENQVAADMAVSVVSHALWLGRELARAEQALRRG
ncbi:MAG TPA: thymidylate synthase [Solirubrobacteraceae bacterium]